MRTFLFRFSLFASSSLASIAFAQSTDLLRFSNGDQLHGSFLGISDNQAISWKRDDLGEPMTLKTENIRHIILQNNTPQEAPADFAYISLSNGDQIPGKVLSFSQENMQIESQTVGNITIPSSAVEAICPNPFGGKLLYVGPFSPDQWEVPNIKGTKNDNSQAQVEVRIVPAGGAAPNLNPAQLQQLLQGVKVAQPGAADAPPKKDENKVPKVAEKPEEKPEPSWKHLGSAWYHLKGLDPLIRKECMTERTLLRFRLAWRERLSANIAFHADFAKAPEPKKEDEKNPNGAPPQRAGLQFFNNSQQTQAANFGNALVLNLYQTYFSLSRCGYDAEGNPFSQPLTRGQSNVQLPDTGEATIEIRSDRSKGLIMLFIDGKYAAQWEQVEQETEEAAEPTEEEKTDPAEAKQSPLGNGFAIQCQNSNSPMRLSDVVIAEWNGIQDSAYSMSHEERDIVLLANGTDRYSGKISRIENGVAFLKSTLSDLEIPLTDIAEIVFAKKANETKEEAAVGTVTARFYPVGKISGIPLKSTKTQLEINHPTAKNLSIRLERSIALEFNDDSPFLEVMDEQVDNAEMPKK